MFQKKRPIFRRIYYIGSIAIMLSAVAIISVPFLINLRIDHNQKLNLLSEGLITQKKAFIKTIIIEKIYDIGWQRAQLLENSGSELNEEDFEELFRQSVFEMIRETILPDDGYIWINEVLDFAGGDDYALRIVHPNLPESEVEMLSTNTPDLMGNLPYLEELNGVKEHGEVYFDYFFKKMNSDKTVHKLSYARLYEPNNWIIATGIYLDDIDALVQVERTKYEAELAEVTQKTVITILIAVFVSFMMTVVFERKVSHSFDQHTEEMQEAYDKIEQMAHLDFLTGLWNRRGMSIQIKHEITRSAREQKDFCFLLADIDYFKKINDKWGHDCGDFILKELSEVFEGLIRNEDSLCRWGGEEFLVMINSANLEQGRMVAEKIRKAVEKRRFIYNDEIIKVTITIGVAAFKPGNDLDTVINNADKNLYSGKAGGRNCVVS